MLPSNKVTFHKCREHQPATIQVNSPISRIPLMTENEFSETIITKNCFPKIVTFKKQDKYCWQFQFMFDNRFLPIRITTYYSTYSLYLKLVVRTAVMHFQDMSQIYVFCKVCEEKYTSVDWLSHWKTCGGAFIHLCPKRDLEAAYVDVKNTVTSTCCNPHFWQVAQQVTGFLILLLLMCFFIVTLVLHTVDGTTRIKSSD